MEPHERIVFALDVPTVEQARQLSAALHTKVGMFKIGLELFTSCPGIVSDVAKYNTPIMLDLKLHDIPATVERTVKNLPSSVQYTTVHVGDDGECVAAAVEANPNVKICAVTVLTSVDVSDASALVAARASFAAEAGAQALICSAKDLPALKKFKKAFEFITPGIRLPQDDNHDQARITTPEEAVRAGASRVVIGRPIRDAKNPTEAARIIADRISEVRV